jgi:hypothetical protein
MLIVCEKKKQEKKKNVCILQGFFLEMMLGMSSSIHAATSSLYKNYDGPAYSNKQYYI